MILRVRKSEFNLRNLSGADGSADSTLCLAKDYIVNQYATTGISKSTSKSDNANKKKSLSTFAPEN